jgi:large subunit ribosomal protein L18
VSLQRKLKQQRNRRALRVRSQLTTSDMPRITVFRSLKHMYAQLIDASGTKTVASCSSLDIKNIKGDKKQQAKAIGKELARRALAQGIDKAQFDRGKFLYHGRVQALAEGLRESGFTV